MALLVPGGPGFIGPHVVFATQRAGLETFIFHRGEIKALLPPGAIEISATDRGRWTR